MAKYTQSSSLPSFDKLLIPIVKALIELGGSGSNEEINARVYEIVGISDDILQIPHGDKGSTSEVDYRLGWSRTFLKKYGLLENSSRGIWALTKADIDTEKLNPSEIVKAVRGQNKPTQQSKNPTDAPDTNAEVEDTIEWKESLLNCLYTLTPAAFERLAQRLLRESGFSNVEVTGKSGDGGIDGKGFVKVSGLLSFPVIFQCKRYKGSISPSQVRDFRGAMQGRADKGLLITTGTFTREAIKEATRDGAPPIDLIDGELLCEKLKELKLGVATAIVEKISIDTDWFIKI